MSYRPQYERQTYRKLPEEEERQLTDCRMFAIVDHKHKLVYDRDGRIIVFRRNKDALKWIEHQKDIPEEWRIIAVNTSIMMP